MRPLAVSWDDRPNQGAAMIDLYRQIGQWPKWSRVLLAVGGFLLFSIPYIGPVLGLSVWLLAFLSHLSMKSQGTTKRGHRTYEPVQITESVFYTFDGQQEVVGESHYHAGIDRVVSAWKNSGAADTPILAILRPEPGNPFDVDAVRVDLWFGDVTEPCGHIPAYLAAAWGRGLRPHLDAGRQPVAHASVYGGTPEKPDYGVWLSSDSARKRPSFTT